MWTGYVAITLPQVVLWRLRTPILMEFTIFLTDRNTVAVPAGLGAHNLLVTGALATGTG